MIVEDEVRLASALQRGLAAEGFTVDLAHALAERLGVPLETLEFPAAAFESALVENYSLLRNTLRVLNTLRLAECFDGVISIEDMTMFGQLRPKPDARMFRRVAAQSESMLADILVRLIRTKAIIIANGMVTPTTRARRAHGAATFAM